MRLSRRYLSFALVLALLTPGWAFAQNDPRARDLGVPFDGTPGKLNAITDVNGVTVGHKTLISGDGPHNVGAGPVRTGVTAILPHGKTHDPRICQLVCSNRQWQHGL